MKIALLITSLIAIGLAACTTRDSQTTPTADPNVVLVSTIPGNYHVYRHCIGGVSYLTFDTKSIIVEVEMSGKPRECRVRND